MSTEIETVKFPYDNYAENSPLYKADEFRMYCFKVLPCSKRYVHDWTICPFAHPGEKARRRDPRLYTYTGVACPEMKKNMECPRGDACAYAHNVFEYWMHPSRYRTQLCNDGFVCCRKVCFFAHTLDEIRVSNVRVEHGADFEIDPFKPRSRGNGKRGSAAASSSPKTETSTGAAVEQDFFLAASAKLPPSVTSGDLDVNFQKEMASLLGSSAGHSFPSDAASLSGGSDGASPLPAASNKSRKGRKGRSESVASPWVGAEGGILGGMPNLVNRDLQKCSRSDVERLSQALSKLTAANLSMGASGMANPNVFYPQGMGIQPQDLMSSGLQSFRSQRGSVAGAGNGFDPVALSLSAQRQAAANAAAAAAAATLSVFQRQRELQEQAERDRQHQVHQQLLNGVCPPQDADPFQMLMLRQYLMSMQTNQEAQFNDGRGGMSPTEAAVFFQATGKRAMSPGLQSGSEHLSQATGADTFSQHSSTSGMLSKSETNWMGSESGDGARRSFPGDRGVFNSSISKGFGSLAEIGIENMASSVRSEAGSGFARSSLSQMNSQAFDNRDVSSADFWDGGLQLSSSPFDQSNFSPKSGSVFGGKVGAPPSSPILSPHARFFGIYAAKPLADMGHFGAGRSTSGFSDRALSPAALSPSRSSAIGAMDDYGSLSPAPSSMTSSYSPSPMPSCHIGGFGCGFGSSFGLFEGATEQSAVAARNCISRRMSSSPPCSLLNGNGSISTTSVTPSTLDGVCFPTSPGHFGGADSNSSSSSGFSSAAGGCGFASGKEENAVGTLAGPPRAGSNFDKVFFSDVFSRLSVDDCGVKGRDGGAESQEFKRTITSPFAM